jgi:hypothetical protein
MMADIKKILHQLNYVYDSLAEANDFCIREALKDKKPTEVDWLYVSSLSLQLSELQSAIEELKLV